jgi:hypothetical protein
VCSIGEQSSVKIEEQECLNELFRPSGIDWGAVSKRSLYRAGGAHSPGLGGSVVDTGE